MPFVAARCPQCGGEIQVDDQKDSGFCLHCGSKIIVQEAIRAVRIDNSHMLETWNKLGLSALEAENYSEAYEYFTRILEVNPEDWFAILYKGYSAGLLSTWEKPRINELIYGIQNAKAIIDKSSLTKEEKISAKNLFPPAIIETYKQYLRKVEEIKINTDFRWLHDDDLMVRIRQNFEKAVDNYQMVLNIINMFDDNLSNRNKLDIKIEIIEQCQNVCWPFIYYKDKEKTERYLFGYKAEEKKRFIDLYDTFYVEVLYAKPNFKPGKGGMIDRLTPPPDKEPDYVRDYDLPSDIAEMVNSAHKAMAYMEVMQKHQERVEEAEKKAEKIRRIKLEEYKKEIYWKEHPEERQKYQEKLIKEKFEQEAKIKVLRSQKEKRVNKKDEIEKEISKLQIDRSKLGLFAGKEKKAIDEKIYSLQQEQREERREIDRINTDIEWLLKQISDKNTLF